MDNKFKSSSGLGKFSYSFIC